MAVFNPEVQTENPKEYTGASGGVIRNTAFGTALEGLGDAIDVKVKNTDYNNQKQIQQEIFAQTDQLNKNWKIDDAVKSRSNSMTGGAPPEGLIQSEKNLSLVGEAYKAGRVSNSHYWAEATKIVKQMRTQFPGYRDEIDNMITQVLGVNPANALRNSLMGEWEDAARAAKTGADDYEKWARTHKVQPDFWARWAAGNPYPPAEAYNYVNIQESFDSQVARDRAVLGLEADRGTATQSKTLSSAFRMVDIKFNQNTVASSSMLGNTYEKIMKSMDDFAANPESLDANKQAELLTGLNQAELMFSNMIEKELSAASSPGSSNSYASMLKDDTEKVREYAKGKFAALRKAITDNDSGVLKFNSLFAQASTDTRVAEMMRRSNAAVNFTALNKLLGPQAVSDYVVKNLGTTLDFAQDMMKVNAITLVGTGKATLVEVIKDLKREGINDPVHQGMKHPDIYNGILDNSLGIIKDKKIPLEARETMAASFFSPENANLLKEFNAESRTGIWRKMSTKSVTDAMLQIKAVNPELWNQYASWTLDQFAGVMNRQAADAKLALSNELERGEFESLRFDSADSKFKFLSKPPANANQAALSEFSRRKKQMETVVNDLNTNLDIVLPILKAEGGNLPEKVVTLFKGAGIDATLPVQGKVMESFKSWVQDALNFSFGKTENDSDNKTKKKETDSLLGTDKPPLNSR